MAPGPADGAREIVEPRRPEVKTIPGFSRLFEKMEEGLLLWRLISRAKEQAGLPIFEEVKLTTGRER